MRILLLAATFGYALAQGPSPAPDVAEIMSRVASNQAKSLDQRKEWVYNQKQLMRLLRGNGKLAREERRDERFTPPQRPPPRKIVKIHGKQQRHTKTNAYTPTV